MSEEEIFKKLGESFNAAQDRQDQKLEKIFKSVEKTRRYFLWTLIITVVMFFLPLLGLLFVIPKFLSIYTTQLNF